jgi:hypothetical protein
VRHARHLRRARVLGYKSHAHWRIGTGRSSATRSPAARARRVFYGPVPGAAGQVAGACIDCPHILTTRGRTCASQSRKRGTVDPSAGPAPFPGRACATSRDFGRPGGDSRARRALRTARALGLGLERERLPHARCGPARAATATRGYCVYPGLAVVGKSADAQSAFQYSADGPPDLRRPPRCELSVTPVLQRLLAERVARPAAAQRDWAR